jgi:hypothetical protein
MSKQFIKDYKGMVSETLCDSIIYLFENLSEFHETKIVDNHYSFTQMELKQPHLEFHKFFKVVNEAVAKYRKDLDISDKEFPSEYGFETFRIKKYHQYVDSFPLHVDVQDHQSSRRFLAIFMYLNNVSHGGNTWFPKQNVSFNPEAGRVLVFPPLWTHPHAGGTPSSNDKYILGTYLHYL